MRRVVVPAGGCHPLSLVGAWGSTYVWWWLLGNSGVWRILGECGGGVLFQGWCGGRFLGSAAGGCHPLLPKGGSCGGWPPPAFAGKIVVVRKGFPSVGGHHPMLQVGTWGRQGVSCSATWNLVRLGGWALGGSEPECAKGSGASGWLPPAFTGGRLGVYVCVAAHSSCSHTLSPVFIVR